MLIKFCTMAGLHVLSLLVVLQWTILVCGADISVKTVQTPSGNVKGILESVPFYNTSVYQYRSIPYAKAPIGDRRFMKPEAFGPWQGVLDGTTFGPSCPQNGIDVNNTFLPNTNMSEDCLFLNIYTPVNTNMSAPIAVMVCINTQLTNSISINTVA